MNTALSLSLYIYIYIYITLYNFQKVENIENIEIFGVGPGCFWGVSGGNFLIILAGFRKNVKIENFKIENINLDDLK